MSDGHPATSFALALAAGVLAQSLARHLRLPGIVVLLLVGVSLGPDGLGWVQPRSLGEGFFAIVDLAVAVILFEGGLNLQISRLRREQLAIRRLVLWGALATLAGGALVAAACLGWGFERSVLFGSLVVVTGPTVVGPLVSELRLRKRVATVLNAEGVLIDPVGAILAVLVLELVLAPTHAGGAAFGLLARIGVGVAMGLGAGLLIARLLRVRRLVPEGLENIFVLASVLLIFQLSNELAAHSGILAVTLAGVTVGNSRTLVDRDLREFKDQLTVMLIGLLFVMLAADVRFEDVAALGWRGVAVVAALIFVVRPLVVLLATRGSELTWRERLFIGWVAPRGIVAAAVASLVSAAMEQGGIEGGAELRALVFLTITGTVVQAGLTAWIVARWLGVQLPRREGAAILGAHGFGLLFAKELRAGGLPVSFLDSNPQSCRQAEEAGFPVTFGNATEERTLQRARLESVEAAIGLTPNQTVNGVFVTRARELFHVPRALVAVEALDTGLVADLVRQRAVEVIFEGVHDIERWDVRVRHAEVLLEHFEFEGVPEPEPEPEPAPEAASAARSAGPAGDVPLAAPAAAAGSPDADSASGDSGEAPARREPPPPPPIGERLVMLAYRRGERPIQPVTMDYEPKRKDRLSAVLHEPEREEARAALEARGWRRVEPEPEAQDAQDAQRDAPHEEVADGGGARSAGHAA